MAYFPGFPLLGWSVGQCDWLCFTEGFLGINEPKVIRYICTKLCKNSHRILNEKNESLPRAWSAWVSLKWRKIRKTLVRKMCWEIRQSQKYMAFQFQYRENKKRNLSRLGELWGDEQEFHAVSIFQLQLLYIRDCFFVSSTFYFGSSSEDLFSKYFALTKS